MVLARLAAAAVYVRQRQRTARLLREHTLRARIAADLHDDTKALPLTRFAVIFRSLSAMTVPADVFASAVCAKMLYENHCQAGLTHGPQNSLKTAFWRSRRACPSSVVRPSLRSG